MAVLISVCGCSGLSPRRGVSATRACCGFVMPRLESVSSRSSRLSPVAQYLTPPCLTAVLLDLLPKHAVSGSGLNLVT